MIITLTKEKTYDLTDENDQRRLKQCILTLQSDELATLCKQIEEANTNDSAVLAIYYQAQDALEDKILLPTKTIHGQTPEQLQATNQTALADLQENGKNHQPTENDLITDVRLFPRCEYYTRFAGTTVFAMDNPAYWCTYYRSNFSRFFSLTGGSKNAQFSSPFVKKPKTSDLFYARTGSFHSLLTFNQYSDAFNLEKQVPEGTTNIYDQLLCYKNAMAAVIVNSFANYEKNIQKIRKKYTKKQHDDRPIVYTEKSYPCVLVALPALNPMETDTKAATYWAKHPKPLQKLLLCSFVAFLNIEAMRENIPIEIVLRESFGHILPSVCETKMTFRINIGVIPKCYAELIGKALHQLNQTINKLADKTSQPMNFDENFINQVKIYNAKKIKKAINKHNRYKALRGTAEFNKAEHSDEEFKKLHQSFCDKNKEKSTESKANFTPVKLENKTIWELLRQPGNSIGKSVLSECFRKNETQDWFTNQIMDELIAESPHPIQAALRKLLNCLIYTNDKVTMDYKKIHAELNKPKRAFTSLSFEKLYEDDPDFSEITQILFDGFCAERLNYALYSELERASTKFILTARGSQEIQTEPDYGSDSEFEDELPCENEDKSAKEKISTKLPFSHSKLRVCSGMKAILLAQYGALCYLQSKGIKNYSQDIENMYYEVKNALKFIHVKPLASNKSSSTIQSNILHFDLNHCNSNNSANNKTLNQKLIELNPSVVILDYTSTRPNSIIKALRQCFSHQQIELVMMVKSGLKNNQGGLDLNPYGEVRICARNKETRKQLVQTMKAGLSEEDKLTPKAHEKIRACKRRGMAMSLFGLFKTDKSRFQSIETKNFFLTQRS